MNFVEALEQRLNNVSITENGAIGYKTSGSALVDLNFAVSSLRNASDEGIKEKFQKAMDENASDAIIWLFFARDARGGLGERRLFKVCFPIVLENVDNVDKFVELVAYYGRFDDLYSLVGTKFEKNVLAFFKKQLSEDTQNYHNKKSISLLAKWLKSENTSSKESKMLAKKTRKALGLTSEDYRNVLSKLRRYIDVVERKMSSNQFGEIDYEKVPSKANLNYRNAFLRHDEDRYREYIANVNKGEAKVNSSVLFPHEIVNKYARNLHSVDESLEALWKNLPNTINDDNSTLVVADGSGSMFCHVGGTSVTAWQVAHALAIYFAERASGEFKNKYITFSSKPRLVNLCGKNLMENLWIANQYCECSNTNIKATFDLILNTAIENKMSQEEMPKNILIISDMEFDEGTSNVPLFIEIEKQYKDYGYELPRLIFWNVNSRTNTIPMTKNDNGVVLLSGFSTNVVKMAMSGELDPYKCLLRTLYSERYQRVIDLLS